MPEPAEHLTEDYLDVIDVQRVRSGDVDAYSAIVHRYSDRIFSLALRITGSREDAEEATQEVFLRAYRAINTYHPDRRFFTWIYTIAVNHLRSMRRRSARRPLTAALSLAEELIPDSDGDASQPEQHALNQSARRLVEHALSRLQPAYREVFALRQLSGLTTREVADCLDLPESTVKTRLRRARHQLQGVLTEAGVEGPSW